AEILGRLITAARVVGSSTLTGASESSALRIDLDRLRRAWILRKGGLEGRRRWRSLIAQASSAPPSLYERLRLETPPLPAVLEAAEGGGPLAEKILSYHSSCARFPPGERAISALRLGEKLLGGGNFHRGERFLRAAKALPVKEGDRSRLEILLGEAALAGGDPERAALHFVAASQIQGLDEELRAKVLFGQAVACFRKGQLDDARSLAVEGGREFPDVPFFQNLLGNIAVLRKENEA